MENSKQAIKELKKIRKISAEIIKFISGGWKEELQPVNPYIEPIQTQNFMEVDADKINTEFQEANESVEIDYPSVPELEYNPEQEQEQKLEDQQNATM